MRKFVIVGAAALLAACGSERSAEEQARADEADIAAVQAAQDIPASPVQPQTIGYPDIEKNKLYGAGCAFAPDGGIAPVALTMPDVGYMKIAQRIERFAPDKGSLELPLGTYGHYDGKEYNFILDIGEGEGTKAGTETTNFPAQLVLKNSRDQVVYQAKGTAQCGS